MSGLLGSELLFTQNIVGGQSKLAADIPGEQNVLTNVYLQPPTMFYKMCACARLIRFVTGDTMHGTSCMDTGQW